MPGRDWDILNTQLTSSIIPELEKDTVAMVRYLADNFSKYDECWLFKAGGMTALLGEESGKLAERFCTKLKNSGSWILSITGALVKAIQLEILKITFMAVGGDASKYNKLFSQVLTESELRVAETPLENEFIDVLIKALPNFYDMSPAGLEKFKSAPKHENKPVPLPPQKGQVTQPQYVVQQPHSHQNSSARNRQTHHVLDQLDAELKSFVPAEVKDIRSGNGPSLYPHEAKSANFSIAKFSKAKDDYEHRKKREKTEYENAENHLARVCAEKEYAAQKRARTTKRTITIVLILLLIAFGLYMLISKVIWPSIYKNKPADDLYTPELLQTYEGIISSGSFKGGQEFITITSCDKNGAVTGYVEMITKDNLYANYAITGQISDKKNSGDLTITFKHGDWIVHPDGWRFTNEEFTVKVRDNYQTMTGDYSLSANSAYANVKNPYAPEILASYISANNNRTHILTVTQCDQSGNVTATWETLRNDDSYMKVRLKGYIAAKKNNGLVIVVWTSNEVETTVGSSGSWNDETYAFFTENGSVVNTDTGVSFTVGEHTANTIKTVEDLQKLSNSSGYYVLKNDIDLSGVNWVPIQGFTGVLEGNGYTIKNMSINASNSNVGFFGELAGIVNNLSFENAQVVVSGYQENVGILCGKLSGEANNITTSGTVTALGCTNVGGIAGLLDKAGAYTLSNLINNAYVNGTDYVGGIFGKVYNYYTNYNPKEVSLERLENSGAITGSGNYVGGIAGYLHMEGGHDYITLYGSSMKNTGTIEGKQYVGGLFGYISTDSSKSSVIDITATGAVTGTSDYGKKYGYAENVIFE